MNVNIGWQEFANKPDMLNAYEYAVLHNQARTNDGLPVVYDPITDLPNYGKGGVYQYTHPDNNYFDQLFKKSTLISNVGINIGGGTKAVRYMVTAGYMHNGGMFNYTDLNDYSTQVRMNRFNLRSNLDINITKNLSAQIDMGGHGDTTMIPLYSGRQPPFPRRGRLQHFGYSQYHHAHSASGVSAGEPRRFVGRFVPLYG